MKSSDNMKSGIDSKGILYNRIPLLILSYLTRNKNNERIYGAKIAQELSISQGGTSTILRQLRNMGILQCQSVGKTVFYNMDFDNPLVKSFRVFENLLELNELIGGLKQLCRKIVLFGSCARGDDTQNSDIDLFIVADEDSMYNIRDCISKYQIEREIKPVIIDTLELISMEESDKVFLQEVNKGIIIWSGTNE